MSKVKKNFISDYGDGNGTGDERTDIRSNKRYCNYYSR